MADFLLVHGSCHGAWCWRDTIPALNALGHTVRAIDLPGCGDDKTAQADVTLEQCGAAVLAASSSETIVVGHSWGGYPISQAAETNPNGIRGLIFLCAYIPINGLSMVDMRKRAKRHPILPAVVMQPDKISMTIDPELAPGLFYNDCSKDIIDYAVPRLGKQALKPQRTPIKITKRYHSKAKAYIRCLKDQTIPPEYQEEMVKDWPTDRVFEMSTSHSPFFSNPSGLAQLLTKIAEAM